MTSLVELRILEGPNLYFPRAAVKLTLDVSSIAEASDETVLRFARRIGLRTTRPGAADSGFRQRFALRAVERLVRAIATEAGTSRLAVRVRPTSDPHVLVVAFPWRNRGRARALGEAVAHALDALPTPDLEAAVSAAAEEVRAAATGERPTTITPKIPVVAVTGTNGKTTTSRMIAHIARTSGLVVGWSNTDGIYRDGVLVEAGDYSGPSGAARALGLPGVQFAVTETARGGILLKGIGITRNDVSVVTNVTADHLGLQGIDTVDQLAEVKSVVPRITRRSGWAVLNGDDPRVLAMRGIITAQPWIFSRDADSPAVREVLNSGGRATTVIDGWITLLAPGADPDPLMELVDVPMTLAGLSRFNIENALAAASAALAIGLPREAVVSGLSVVPPGRRAQPGADELLLPPRRRLGRHGPRPQRGRARGAARDHGRRTTSRRAPDARPRCRRRPHRRAHRRARRDRGQGERRRRDRAQGARTSADAPSDEIDGLLRAGAERVGVTDIDTYPTEVECLAALVERARPGDVVGLMCHAERQEAYDWIADHGGTADTPETLSQKVRAASA